MLSQNLLKINFAQGFQYEQVFIPNINNKIEIIFDKQNYRKYCGNTGTSA